VKRLILLFLPIILLSACKKDDESSSLKKDTLTFQKFSDTDIRLWVGGELQNPDYLNMELLVEDYYFSLISFERARSAYFYFDGDTLDMTYDDYNTRSAYSISNDTIYTHSESTFGTGVYKSFFGIGTSSEISLQHCLIYHAENGTPGSSAFEVKYYQSFEDNPYFQTPEDMGPNDTLVLYNQTRLYQ
jgi:hypothetical protein